MKKNIGSHLDNSLASGASGQPREYFTTTNFLIFLVCYFSLHVLVRVISSPSLELDEAEQVLLSQWLLPGYTAQPPLYTWLQFFMMKAVGINVLALSLLKNILLFLAYLFVFIGTRTITKSSTLGAIASLSLLFMPQISWGAQRDLTHSVLMFTASSIFFYLCLKLMETEKLRYYVFLGFSLGLGVLSKYNFCIFAAAIVLASISISDTRRRITNPRVILSLLIAGFIVIPYFQWALANPTLATSSLHKFHMATLAAAPRALANLFLHSLVIVAPLAVVYGIFFPQGFRRDKTPRPGNYHVLLARFFIALVVILIFLVVVFHVTKLKNRWLAPLFLLAPVYFADRFSPQEAMSRRTRAFFHTAMATATLILLAMAFRIFGAGFTGFVTDLNYPSKAIAEEIRALGFQKGTIVTDRQVTGGDMKIQFPRSLVLCPSLKRLTPRLSSIKMPLVLLWRADDRGPMPNRLSEYVEKHLHISTAGNKPVYKNFPMYLCARRFVRVGIMLVR